MPRVLYVEPSDGIADLIQRVRDEPEPAVALVIPADAEVLQTPLNVRLMAQLAARDQRQVAVISGDPRVQALVREAGLTAYASVPAYERGIEVVQPHPSALPVADPAAWVDQPVAAREPGPRIPRPRGRGWLSRRPLYFGLVGVLFMALLAFLVFSPSAHITVTIGATELDANPTIEGSVDPAAARQGDHILTEVVTADAANKFTANPTGTQTQPPTAATASIVFTTDLPFGSSFPIQKGEAFQTGDSPPIVFYATQDVAVAVPAPLVPGQHGGPSNPVPVQDGTPEARGNVPAGAISIWPRNPCNPTDPSHPRLCAPSDLTLTNPSAASGGAAEKKLVIASDQDLQNFHAQVDSLKKALTDAVSQALTAKAVGRQFAIDGSGNGRTFSADISPALPKANAQYAPTVITVTIHGRATVFSLDDIRRALVADLSAQVPKGETLATEQLTISPPRITQAADNGDVVLAETATGFSRPTVTLEGLRSTLAGKSPDDVRRLIERRIGRPVLNMQIVQTPISGWPLLPFFSSRIDLEEKFVANRRTSV